MSVNKKSLKPYSALGKAGAAPPLTGLWQNELDSIMNITSMSGANFSGTYTSSVSGGGGPVTGSLSGTISGDAIGFTVNWSPAANSVTSWNGLLLSDAGNPVIYTLWHLATTPEQNSDFWESILAGADLFVPYTPMKK